MNLLESILNHKKLELEERKKQLPLSLLREKTAYARKPLSLSAALRTQRPAIIAEIKKASPSRSVIREEFDPVAIARSYVKGGAAALSVLTDYSYFRGRIEYIEQIRPVVPIPILRKDFTIDPYQVHEAKAYGADAILLIAAALESPFLDELQALAQEIGLECVVEVHSEKEIQSLDGRPVTILGINNRDLRTFETDLNISLHLQKSVRHDTLVVSESGIRGSMDMKTLMA